MKSAKLATKMQGEIELVVGTGVMGQALGACGKKKYHEKQTELIMLMANSLNLVSKFTEFTDQFH
jgi:hypothetical protein